MKKKLLVAALSAVSLLSLASCNNDNKEDYGDDYTAKIYYPDGSLVKPEYNTDGTVKPGMTVQWCTLVTCLSAKIPNDKGIIVNDIPDLPEGERYYVHLNNVPEGYTYNSNAYQPDLNNRHVEIQLVDLKEPTSTVTIKNPVLPTLDVTANNIGVGAYETTVSMGGFEYFIFTAPETASYEVESWATIEQASNSMDPMVGFFGEVKDSYSITDYVQYDDGGHSDNDYSNFKFTIEAEAGKSYLLLTLANDAESYLKGQDASYVFNIQKA